MPQEPFLFILLLLTLFSLLAAAAAAILAAKAAGNGRTDMDGLYNALDRQRTALSADAGCWSAAAIARTFNPAGQPAENGCGADARY